MSPVTWSLIAGAVASGSLATSVAFADDKAACLDASLQAQSLRAAHQLVEAREQLRVCATSRCPAVVAADCSSWLAEVEKALPSIVLSARSAAGADLVDVRVSVDGKPLVSKLDGQAMPMDAGAHTFHFEGADGPGLDQQVVVKEGEKNQAVAVVLGAPAPPPAPVIHDRAAEGPQPSSAWKTVGWVLGGVGIVGLGVGTAFGVIALGNKSSDCPTSDTCKVGSLSGLRSDALVSDIGLIAGGALLAGGVALVLFSPGASRESPSAAGAVRVSPSLMAGGGGALLSGAW
jgi:hypothetical protein